MKQKSKKKKGEMEESKEKEGAKYDKIVILVHGNNGRQADWTEVEKALSNKFGKNCFIVCVSLRKLLHSSHVFFI